MTSGFSGWLPSRLPPKSCSRWAASGLTATVAASDCGFNGRSSDPQGVAQALRAADERAGIGRHAADLELQVQVRTDRQAGAADEADGLPLLDQLSDLGRGERHVRVYLDEPIAVGDRDAHPKVVRVTRGRHPPAGRRDDRRAKAREQVDAGVEME